MSILPLKWLIQAYIVVAAIYIVLADTQDNRSSVNTNNETGRSIISSSSSGNSHVKPFKPSPLAVTKKKQKSLRPSSYYKYYNHSQKRDDSFGSSYGAPTGGVVGYFPPEPPISSLVNSAYGVADYGAPHSNVPPHSNYGASAPALPNSNYGVSGPALPNSNYGVSGPALPHSNYGAIPSGPSSGHGHGPEHGHGHGGHGPDISIPSHGLGVQSSYNAPSAILGSSYSAPVSSSYDSPTSYAAPVSMSYGSPTMSYGVPGGGYGSDEQDEGKGKGKGLIGLIGLLGLKGLLPKAFSIISALFPLILLLAAPLIIINLPMILPLALPLLLPLALPILLPVLALGILFFPVPVITIPATGRNYLAQKREEFSRAIHNGINEGQCIERISCEISSAAKKYGINYEPFKSVITKNDKYTSVKWVKNILKGVDDNTDCKKYTCSWNSSDGDTETKKKENVQTQ